MLKRLILLYFVAAAGELPHSHVIQTYEKQRLDNGKKWDENQVSSVKSREGGYEVGGVGRAAPGDIPGWSEIESERNDEINERDEGNERDERSDRGERGERGERRERAERGMTGLRGVRGEGRAGSFLDDSHMFDAPEWFHSLDENRSSIVVNTMQRMSDSLGPANQVMKACKVYVDKETEKDKQDKKEKTETEKINEIDDPITEDNVYMIAGTAAAAIGCRSSDTNDLDLWSSTNMKHVNTDGEHKIVHRVEILKDDKFNIWYKREGSLPWAYSVKGSDHPKHNLNLEQQSQENAQCRVSQAPTSEVDFWTPNVNYSYGEDLNHVIQKIIDKTNQQAKGKTGGGGSGETDETGETGETGETEEKGESGIDAECPKISVLIDGVGKVKQILTHHSVKEAKKNPNYKVKTFKALPGHFIIRQKTGYFSDPKRYSKTSDGDSFLHESGLRKMINDAADTQCLCQHPTIHDIANKIPLVKSLCGINWVLLQQQAENIANAGANSIWPMVIEKSKKTDGSGGTYFFNEMGEDVIDTYDIKDKDQRYAWTKFRDTMKELSLTNGGFLFDDEGQRTRKGSGSRKSSGQTRKGSRSRKNSGRRQIDPPTHLNPLPPLTLHRSSLSHTSNSLIPGIPQTSHRSHSLPSLTSNSTSTSVQHAGGDRYPGDEDEEQGRVRSDEVAGVV